MKAIDKLKMNKEKYDKIYEDKVAKLRNKCKHTLQKHTGHAGTDYQCTKCGLWI